MAAQDTPVTELLAALGRGDAAAGEHLLPIIYRDLRAIAGHKMAGERAGHTLTPTALVHEAWLRLLAGSTPDFHDRRHFLAIAAIAMRRILIDHARTATRDKRGPGWRAVTLDGELGEFADSDADPAELLALDTALSRLEALDALMARVVELRYFGGLTVEEAAEVLDTSPRSINRAWTAARAWLGRELKLA